MTVRWTLSDPSVVATADRVFYDSNATGNYEIYSCNVDGSNVVQVTNNSAYDSFWPKVKPDGTKLMFCRVPAGTGTGAAAYLLNEYWTCGISGSNPVRVYTNPSTNGWTAQGTPNWHPIANEVCHWVKAAGTYTVRTLNASANPFVAASTRTTAGGGANAVQVDTSYTPSGTQIIFADYRTGDNAGLYVASLRVVDRIGLADSNLANKLTFYPCTAATTANITLSGTQTVDGVALTAGVPCLVKNQTTASANGVYIVSAGAWTRAGYFNTGAEFVGSYVWVYSGTANANKMFEFASNTAPTLGTTSISYTDVTSTGRIPYCSGAVIQYPNDPYVSPDGTNIAYLQKVDNSHSGVGNWDVKLVAFGGSRITTVIGDDNINSKPAWLTNTTILFHRWRWATDTGFGCWRIDTNGSNLSRFVARGEYPEPGAPIDRVTFEINPDAGGTATLEKNLVKSRIAPGAKTLVWGISDKEQTIEFSGTILTQTMYNLLDTWFSKPNPVTLTDDQGRVHTVRFTKFEPRRVFKASNPWQHTYTVSAQVIQ